MLSKELNELLTRTGPDTPMGQLIKRYWIPALLSEEVATPGGPPAQVRILGEELVAFRDSEGRLGLLEEHCLHRGTSLYYGRPEGCGLRCIYHGWLYDVEGRVLDTPAEPADSTFKDRLRQRTYPVHEAAGIVWTYLGPPEKKPLFPTYAFAQVPTDHTYVTKAVLECNYLQGLEGECDSAHLSLLHREFNGDGLQRLYSADAAPAYEMEETDFGMRLIASRRAPEGQTYVRVSSFVLPISCWVPAIRKEIHIYVPIDDTHCWRYDLGFLDRPVTEQDVHRRKQIGPDYRRLRTQANHYLQDRALQQTFNMTGIDDFLNHDACATETMGPIYDRSREHLGQSDKALIAVRRYLIDVLERFQQGEEPPHYLTDPDQNDMRHVDTLAELIPAGTSWREHFPHLVLRAGAGSPAPVTGR
jgi:nitrite reductase/ring-hydroxylating ferredoxin subunit